MTNNSDLTRIWVHVDPTSDNMMKLAALYVLYAVLDKTGGFPKKAGVTKEMMARGAIRSFIFKRRDRARVLRTLNAYDAVVASTDRNHVQNYANICRVSA
jgi:hypothetical protein